MKDKIIQTIKGALKSKTVYFSMALSVLVPVLEQLPNLKSTLADNYGIAVFTLSVIIAALRVATTTALAEK